MAWSRYRIIEILDKNGDLNYYPQKRVLFWWTYYKVFSFRDVENKSCDTFNDAVTFIQEQEETKTFPKKYYWYHYGNIERGRWDRKE